MPCKYKYKKKPMVNRKEVGMVPKAYKKDSMVSKATKVKGRVERAMDGDPSLDF